MVEAFVLLLVMGGAVAAFAAGGFKLRRLLVPEVRLLPAENPKHPSLTARQLLIRFRQSPSSRAASLRELLRRHAEAPETSEAVEQVRTGFGGPLLRMIVAHRHFDEDRDLVREYASSKRAPAATRSEAIRVLRTCGTLADLLEIENHPVPADAAVDLVLYFRDAKHAAAESIILRYIDEPHARMAAVDGLATCGEHAALPVLVGLLDQGGLEAQEEIAVNVALELIRDRLGLKEIDGALALIEAGGGAGQLSEPERGGALSEVDVQSND